MIDYGRLRTDLLALAVLAMAVFLGLSLVSYDPADPPAHVVFPAHSQPTNLCGVTGAVLAHSLVVAVGAGAYFVLVALIVLDIHLFARDVYNDPVIRISGAILIFVSVCVAAQWYLPVRVSGSLTGNGGYVGAWVSILLDQHFSRVGSLVLLATASVAGVLLTGEQHLLRTAICFSLLPITMWGRLAFGKRPITSYAPVISTASESPSSSPGIPPGPSDTDAKSDDPATSPDLPVSLIRVNAPPSLTPSGINPTANASVATPMTAVAPSLPTMAATSLLPTVLSPQFPPTTRVSASAPLATALPLMETHSTATPPSKQPTAIPRVRQNQPQIVVSDGTLAPEIVAAIATLFAPQVSEQELAFQDQPVGLPLAAPMIVQQNLPQELQLASPAIASPVIMSTETHEVIPLGVPIAVEPPVPTSFLLSPERSLIRVNPPLGMNAAGTSSRSVQSSASRAPYRLPDTTILDDAEAFPYDLLASRAQVAAATLEKTFLEFGLNVKVVEIDTGPVITQFELELEKGLRLSKVTALADDLAIALRVSSVRVIAPIPGKNSVGVEVPNDVRVMVRLKELIDSCRADVETKAIPMFLGKDASGKPLVIDMCKMPHLLIAGRTGTGKSVCLNTLIVSMLMTRSPDQVKMLMIDPKMVELSPYSRIPHLMHPVITDMKKAEAVLGWAVDKMEERYQLLSAVGVRHIDSYNKMGRDKVLKKLGVEANSEEAALVPESIPYIVIVADEMADMMMTSGKDVEGHIIRLAQKSRAVGIHLVLATQKPTVDVITGLIKSNLPARIAFQVASRMDSRVVLDEMGADKLLGKGDMLYMAPETSTLQRAQGTYVSDEEVNKVIAFFADQEPQYDEELAQLKAAPAAAGKGGKGGQSTEPRDDIYDEAVEVVIREGRGSVSLLQRALGVGYGRGARLIDWMAEDGIVGGYNGSQAREVAMSLDEWEEIKESREMAVGRK